MRSIYVAVQSCATTVWQSLGISANNTTHAEKLVSGFGAAIGILIVYGALCFYSHDHALVLLLASVAASSVLVFAVPHGALSQPWPVIGSYLISGVIGVSCNRWIEYSALSAVLAVGLSVSFMHYFRCLHPPGGAVALIAVTGGAQTQAIGYDFIIAPVLINACMVVFAGILFNSLFPWRRYPMNLQYLKPSGPLNIPEDQCLKLSVKDYQYALDKHNSFVDVSPDEIAELVESAYEHARINKKAEK
ncbi:MAG: HPP family protein [Hahellaceae bacterium]|jgi:CBS domain-containing membrane protein|nr:HPP family protein [Hahellaceae bacterium]